MKKYIPELENAIIVKTRIGEHAVVRIASNDLLQGEENERAKESVSEYIFNALYWQAQEQAKSNIQKAINLL